ncbi:MAG: hypothetical protein JO242_26225 [Streptosporangiaceae bacterium]|nr:hypothetical protein [Streptosporangiaceae bacterium]
MKLWALVPLAVIILLLLLHPRQWRRPAALAGGTVAGIGLPLLPFLIVAPGALIRGVLVGQFVRSSNGGQAQLLQRLADMLGLSVFPHFPLGTILLLIAIAIAALYLAGSLAARRPPAALDWYALVTAVAVTVMFLLPRLYYHHYGAFFGQFLALVLALPAGRLAVWAAGASIAGASAARGRGPVAAATAIGVIAAVVVAWAGARDLVTESRLSDNSVAGVADRLIPPGACVLTNEAAFTVTASRFIPDAPGCPSMVDSFGTLIAMTSGRDMGAAPPVLSAVTSVWRSAFERASYVWLLTGSQGQIPWTRSLYAYFRTHYRLIGLASRDGPTWDVPQAGIYARRA